MIHVTASTRTIRKVESVTIKLGADEALALMALVGSFGDEYDFTELFRQLTSVFDVGVHSADEDTRADYLKFVKNAELAIAHRAKLNEKVGRVKVDGGE